VLCKRAAFATDRRSAQFPLGEEKERAKGKKRKPGRIVKPPLAGLGGRVAGAVCRFRVDGARRQDCRSLGTPKVYFYDFGSRPRAFRSTLAPVLTQSNQYDLLFVSNIWTPPRNVGEVPVPEHSAQRLPGALGGGASQARTGWPQGLGRGEPGVYLWGWGTSQVDATPVCRLLGS
jgi:hypothetical protein